MRACGTPTGAATAVTTLFNDEGDPHDDYLVWFKRVALDAYNGAAGPVGSGNGPALRHFRPDMLADVEEPMRGLAA